MANEINENDTRAVRLGRPPIEEMEPETLISKMPTLRIWIDPVTIEPYEEERRDAVRVAFRLLQAAGITMHLQNIRTDPTEVRLYSRWTLRRVSIAQVEDLIDRTSEGITLDSIVQRLYREEPWSEAARTAATNRARQVVYRLQRDGRILRRRGPDGQARFHHYSAQLSSTPVDIIPTNPSIPDDLRAAGWTVAVHNDYCLGNIAHTFWLFTHGDGRYVKGEGRTDTEALDQIRTKITTT